MVLRVYYLFRTGLRQTGIQSNKCRWSWEGRVPCVTCSDIRLPRAWSVFQEEFVNENARGGLLGGPTPLQRIDKTPSIILLLILLLIIAHCAAHMVTHFVAHSCSYIQKRTVN